MNDPAMLRDPTDQMALQPGHGWRLDDAVAWWIPTPGAVCRCGSTQMCTTLGGTTKGGIERYRHTRHFADVMDR